MSEDGGPGPAHESLDRHDRAIEPLERRVRLLAAAYVPAGRVEAVVRDTLAEVARELGAGSIEPGPGFATAAWRIARRRIGQETDSETFEAAALLIECGERAGIARCLEQMDAADRDLLRSAFVDGRSPAEIAMIEGSTPEEVRRRKRQAMDRFLALFRSSSET